MVHSPDSSTYRGAKHPGVPALALRNCDMATTLVSVETREVVRCDYCSLVQYRTSNSLCRKCRRPLDIEEPTPLAPQLVTATQTAAAAEAGLQVAAQVREIRRARHLSQRQLAGRMQVPRTYISKIENGKAIPTLGSLERLADALEVSRAVFNNGSASRFRLRAASHRRGTPVCRCARIGASWMARRDAYGDSRSRTIFGRAACDASRQGVICLR